MRDHYLGYKQRRIEQPAILFLRLVCTPCWPIPFLSEVKANIKLWSFKYTVLIGDCLNRGGSYAELFHEGKCTRSFHLHVRPARLSKHAGHVLLPFALNVGHRSAVNLLRKCGSLIQGGRLWRAEYNPIQPNWAVSTL